MSGTICEPPARRPVAEIVADLRAEDFVKMAHLAAIGLAVEAADRLEALDALVARLARGQSHTTGGVR